MNVEITFHNTVIHNLFNNFTIYFVCLQVFHLINYLLNYHSILYTSGLHMDSLELCPQGGERLCTEDPRPNETD